MRDVPLQFSPDDWLRDPAIRSLGYVERGVWLEIMIFMNEPPRRGYLYVGKKPATEEMITRMLCIDRKTYRRVIAILIDRRVAKVHPRTGALYSEMILADERLRKRLRHSSNPPDLTRRQWRDIRFLILERDGYRCVYCPSDSHISVDHIVPVIRGGTSTEWNLVAACRSCNSSKGAKLLSEWAGRP